MQKCMFISHLTWILSLWAELNTSGWVQLSRSVTCDSSFILLSLTCFYYNSFCFYFSNTRGLSERSTAPLLRPSEPPAYQHPSSSGQRSRPSSTLNSRPRSTGVCRARSARYSWPATKWENIDVLHFPPSGPDCLPGCGYSGLPCYVCSAKEYGNPIKLTGRVEDEVATDVDETGGRATLQIWTIFGNRNSRRSRIDPTPAPVHQSTILRNSGTRYSGPPPSYRSIFPSASASTCWEKVKEKLGLPRMCSGQLMMIMMVIYGFLVSQLIWATL